MYMFQPPFVAILREVLYKYILQRHQKPVHRYKILSFKMYGLKHILEYKIHTKLFVLNLSEY
jgi:hypothetical protein